MGRSQRHVRQELGIDSDQRGAFEFDERSRLTEAEQRARMVARGTTPPAEIVEPPPDTLAGGQGPDTQAGGQSAPTDTLTGALDGVSI